MPTKLQQRREARYRRALRQCGFRSWVRANRRRSELIALEIASRATADEQRELAQLQKLADVYVRWKTNDSTGRSIRCLKWLGAKLGLEDF